LNPSYLVSKMGTLDSQLSTVAGIRRVKNQHFGGDSTLRVQSFTGRNFRGDKLSRTTEVKINFRGYKLSRMLGILRNFSYFDAIFSDFLIDISRMPMKVRFRGYKLSRVPKKLAKSRNFLPSYGRELT
jgi:hypothetical protein